MNEEIKEILDKLKRTADTSFFAICGTEEELKNMPTSVSKVLHITDKSAKILLDYITNLQQENERLKNNQVKTLNRIRDFINSSKCEITEGYYSNDKHSQYWAMFKQFAEELQDKIKGLDAKDYVYIPKWREEELLNQEEQLEDYKSRCEKAIEYIKGTTFFGLRSGKTFMSNYLNDLLNILQNGSDSQ